MDPVTNHSRAYPNLAVLNPDRQTLPGPTLLHDMVTRSADHRLLLDFLLADGRRVNLTYAEFHAVTDILSFDIRQRLAKSQSPSQSAGLIVPLVIPQCPELYIAWVAALKAGAAVCPVSHDVPRDRLAFIVDDVQAALALTTPDRLDYLHASLPQVTCLAVSLSQLQDRRPAECQLRDRPVEAVDVDPAQPAYVMYTSGSTGLPKGVLVSHRSVTQSLLAHDAHVPAFKRFLQFASPTFDVSVFEIFFPFYRGATLAACDRDRMLADLPGTMRILDVDAAELTPTVAGTLLKARAHAPGLTTLLTIGEMLTPQVIAEFGGDAHKPSMLWAMYGPTEAAIHCTMVTAMASDASVRAIGRPLATTTALILSDTDPRALARLDEPGELAIAGQLADGYVNRPDQTRESFTTHPEYGRIYRTGDRAVCRQDGTLEILGRMVAGQVKLRGQRVELGEIEQVAAKTPGVHLAIAAVLEDVLVVFCAAEGDVGEPQVSHTCRSWLPPYMCPREFVFLPGAVPRLPSGKVDRNRLQQDYRAAHPSVQGQDSVHDELERTILETLQRELGKTVGRRDSLWALGLDSLRAITVTSRLREQYETVDVKMVAKAASVVELAARIHEAIDLRPIPESRASPLGSNDWKQVAHMLKSDPSTAHRLQGCEKLLPCNPIQQAMLAETVADSTQNFNEIWLNISAEVELEHLFGAFATLARHNEILRAGFLATGHRSMPFMQVVWPELTPGDLSLLRPLQLEKSRLGDKELVVVRIHHALYDGWSWELILDDVNHILSGRSPLVRPPFSDFCSLQLSRKMRENAPSRTYWHGALHDLSPCVFPNLSPSLIHTAERRSVTISLSTSCQKLSDTARSLRLSKETMLESAWSLVLSSYVDSLDVVMGVVSAGRHLPLRQVESVIGPCLSMLPLRVDLGALRTAHDLFNHIQCLHERLLQHDSVSLSELKHLAGINPHAALFDTLCVWQQTPESPNRDRSKVTTLETRDALRYVVVLEFEPREDDFSLKMTYDAAKIPLRQAELLVQQFDLVSTRLIDRPDRTLDRIWSDVPESLSSCANTSYEEWQGAFDLTTTIMSLARTHPNRTAVEFVYDFDPDTGALRSEILTYSELLEKASNVATTLKASYHVRPNDLVCLFAARSISLYIGILGIVLAGAGYLCIDPSTPLKRVKRVLSDSRSRIVLRGTGVDLPPDQMVVTTISLTELVNRPSRQAHAVTCGLNDDRLAYAIFTSGTTGVPKGVQLTCRNLLSNLEHLSQLYPCNPDTDRLLQACSPAFDVSVFEIFWTWHRGMSLCSASNDVLYRDIEHLIHRLQITHLSMTPSVAALVRPENVPRVKMLVTAGEPMNPKVFANWAGHGLQQGYGPSETTNICNVRPNVSKIDAPNNVGPALPNTSVFICERSNSAPVKATSTSGDLVKFNMLPRGGVGEIWIGGEQVGRGYFDPALNDRQFIIHPSYGRLYRSGDIGRLLCDDSLVILGREDDQIKLRGQRVELGEINSCLVKCHQVEDVYSMVLTQEHKEARLVSFWTSTAQEREMAASAITTTLFDALRNELPEYMIPDVLFRVDTIPLTAQGKVDHKNMVEMFSRAGSDQLQELSQPDGSSEGEHELVGNEMVIGRAISEVLDVPRSGLGRHVSFFALGLDSINAIEVARRLRGTFSGVEISKILRNPSIAQLLVALGTSEGADANRDIAEEFGNGLDKTWKSAIIETYSRAGLAVQKFLPCTALQTSMAMASMDSSLHVYHNKLTFSVRVDMSVFCEAWKLAISRHQLLRTGFACMESDDTPIVQAVLQHYPLPWSHDEMQPAKTTELDFLMLPPWALRVGRTSSGVFEVTLEMHHCVYDAEAMNILLSEIQASCHGEKLPSPVAFERYLIFMESTKEAGDAFWKHLLSGASPCRLGDLIRPEDRRRSSGSLTKWRKSGLTVSEIHITARKVSATPLAVVQAAWARLLCSIFKSDEVCFGNVLSGRNLPVEGIERIFGPCFNTVPMRVQVAGQTSIGNLCETISCLNSEILPYQPSSLRRMLRLHCPDGKPPFDTLVLFQNESLQLDTNIWTLIDESGVMSFPFILDVSVNAQTDNILLRLHSQVAKSGILEKLVQTFDGLLTGTARFRQARTQDYSIINRTLPDFLPSTDVPLTQKPENYTHVNGVNISPNELSEDERLVAQILQQLKPDTTLKLTRETSIFRLGLDSISAVQIAAALRKHAHEISSAEVLGAATVSNIAMACRKISMRHKTSPQFDLDAFDTQHRTLICGKHTIDENQVEAIWPCTATQTGIISQYLRTSNPLYVNRLSLKLDEGLDLVRLRSCWRQVQSRHEILRTGFVEIEAPHMPFAMLVYRTSAVQLPWVHIAHPAHSSDSSLDHFPGLLHPPWHLQLSIEGSFRTLDICLLHALYDAYSLDIILRDIACLYRGMDVPEPVPVSRALSEIMSTSESEESKPFWCEIRHEMAATHFPDMRIYTSNVDSFHTSYRRSTLKCGRLEHACAAKRITLQAACAAAWAVILSAYASQDCVTFGIILSGRDFKSETDNEAVFPCINTVPFSIQVSANQPEILRRATTRCINLMRYQRTPVSAIKRWTNREDELFDTVMVLQKYGSSDVVTAPWTRQKDHATSEYAVALEILPRDDNLVDLELSYRARVLPPQQAEIVLEEFEMVLGDILGLDPDPGMGTSCLSIVPASEMRLKSRIQFLHEFVEARAIQNPDAIALEFITTVMDGPPGKQTWTYSELNSRGNQIAHVLQDKNVEPGELVAICFDKCPEASFSILGILKAGCGYVAIDPSAPKARKDFIVRDSGCKVILTSQDKTLDFYPSQLLVMVSLTNFDWRQPSSATPVLSRKLEPQDTCYCLYTSGTTGTPKGCLISHDSAVQAMLSFQRIFEGRWNAKSRWLQFAAFHFDVSVLEQYWSWSVGICVTSAPRDLMLEDLPGFINAAAITHLDLTPSLARLLSPRDVPSLCQGVFIVGGEQVSQDILDVWGDSQCLYNFYGPSEVTIGCTVHQQVSKHAKPSNIGQQWDNVGSIVLDPTSQQPVLRGAVGELCLSGPLVGKGYLNRPELTAEKFVMLSNSNTRIYRTGDLVRLLHDDSFEFLGRIDDQVKLRGQRLEIGEINHTASKAIDEVRDVFTMVLKHPAQKTDHLVLFFSARQRQSRSTPVTLLSDPSSRELAIKLKKACSDRLSGYMVPSQVLALSSIPLTVNNKVDQRALKDLFAKSSPDTIRSDTKDSESIQKVTNILADFLASPTVDISPSSRLFELGIDSISAIALSRAFKRHNLPNLDVGTILKHPVVQDLAAVIQTPSSLREAVAIESTRNEIEAFAHRHRESILSTLHLNETDIEYIAPCTALQEGMISRVLRGERDDATYFSHFQYELSPSVELDRLVTAWKRAQQSISILRTYFAPTSDGFAQVTVRSPHAQNVVHHMAAENGLSSWSTGLSNQQWVRHTKQFSGHLPWRVETMSRGGGKSMNLHIFHGLYDGLSLSLLLRQVKQLYEQPQEPPVCGLQFYEILPYGPISRPPAEGAFWSSRLSSFGAEKLWPSHFGQKLKSGLVRLQVEIEAPAVLETCIELNVTNSAFFQASLLYVVAQTHRINPAIGVVVTGRAMAEQDVSQVIGPMFNTVLFAVDHLDKGSTLSDLARACHRFNVDMIPYQHTPLRRVAKYIGRDMTRPLFGTLFVFQRATAVEDKCNLWSPVSSESSPDFPVNLEVKQDGASFTVSLISKADYLDETAAQKLLDLYLDTVQRGQDWCVSDLFCQARPEGGVPNFEQRVEPSLPSSMDVGSNTQAWTNDQIVVRDQVADLAMVAIDTIGLHDPTLFELGLDSVEAMKLTTRLKSVGLKVTHGAILRAPTIAGIADAVTREHAQNGETSSKDDIPLPVVRLQGRYRHVLEVEGVDPLAVECALPVTPMQEGLLADLEKYWNFLTYQVKPEISLAKFVEAWQKTIETQPVLRTRFQIAALIEGDMDASFFQYVERHGNPVQQIDDDDAAGVVSVLAQDCARLGLQGLRPVIWLVVSLLQEPVLVLGMPHALYDAWSLHLLHQQVARFYHAIDTNADHVDANLAYRTHVDQLVKQCRSQESHRFWKRLLSGINSSLFRAKTGRQQGSCSSSSTLQRISTSSTLGHAAAFCKRHGVTLQSLGLSCWTIALCYYLRQSEVCFGLILSGRTTESSAQLIFPTFNTVIFRSRIDSHLNKIDMLKATHTTAMEVSSHQHFPLRDALRLARGQVGLAEVFDTLFTFQKNPSSETDVPLLYTDKAIEGKVREPPYAVNVELEGLTDQLVWTIAMQSGIGGAVFGREVLATLDTILDSIMNREYDPIVDSHAQGDSLCGLPAIQLQPSPPFEPEDENAVGISNTGSHLNDETEWSERERRIRHVLAKVSASDEKTISKTTGLFQLGLDSISAITVARLLKGEGIKLPVSAMIAAQTIEHMAEAATDARLDGCERPHPSPFHVEAPFNLKEWSIPDADVESVFPATGGQIFALDTWRATGGRLFYPTFCFELSGAGREMVQAAIDELVTKAAILRTAFVHVSDGAVQKTLQVVLESDAARRYRLPWSVRLVERRDRVFLIFKIHHALYDAVSLALMVSQIEDFCGVVGHSATSALSDWRDFVFQTHGRLEMARKFWMGYLRTAEQENGNLKRGSFGAGRLERYDAKVLNVSTILVKVKQWGISFHALFFATYGKAYLKLLEKYNPSRRTRTEVVVGVYLANRSLDLDNLPDLVAPTFNVVPVRICFGVRSLLETAVEVQQHLADISKLEHCGISLRELYSWCGVPIDTFVNFLSLPDLHLGGAAERPSDLSGHAGVRMVSASLSREEKASWLKDEMEPRSPLIGNDQPGDHHVRWCRPAIDVEAKVEEGLLSCGIFAPEDMISEADADGIVEEIRAALMGMT